MILHGDPSSGNVYKPQLLLAFLGQEYEHVPTSWEDGGTTDPEFLKLNPNGKVPVLIDGDFVLPESNAMLQYLANGTGWWPTDRQQQAQTLQWMFFEQYSHEPFIAVSRAVAHYEKDPVVRAKRMASKRAGGEAALGVMEQHLANRQWFVGDGPTVADIALFAYTHVAPEGGFALEPFPAIQAWVARMQALPGFVGMAPFADKS